MSGTAAVKSTPTQKAHPLPKWPVGATLVGVTDSKHYATRWRNKCKLGNIEKWVLQAIIKISAKKNIQKIWNKFRKMS